MKDSRSCSYLSTRTTDGNYFKNFGSPSRKLDEKSKKKKKSRMVIAKFFALNANAKTSMAIAKLFLLNVNAINN